MTAKSWPLWIVSGLLLWGTFLVLGPFLPAIFWAAILVLISWPLYQNLLNAMGKQPLWAALSMTLLLALSVFVPVTLIGVILTREVGLLLQSFQSGTPLLSLAALAQTVESLPFGSQLSDTIRGLDIPQVQAALQARAGQILGVLAGVGLDVTQSIITLGLTIFTAFFLYYNGDYLAQQITLGLDRLGGKPLVSLIPTLTNTIQAVILGLVLTALAQGFLAGLGLWVAGVPGPVLLAVLVALVSVVQVPTPIVWFPCVIWLISQGELLPAAGLMAWGTLVVGTIDNILKPIFISQGTGIPFLLVFFGVLGGLLAFGTLGIVLGPVVLSLLITLWRRWLTEPEELPPPY